MTETMTARTAIVPCAACGKLNRVDLNRVTVKASCAECHAALALDVPLVLTDATFDKVVANASVPVLVDFHADWCGPCRAMAPVFADFARRQAGQVLVAKVDTDRNPVIASRFAIRSIPTLTVHRDGKETARQVGAVSIAALEQLVQRGR
ncbi:MAG: thioredoxin [Gemmatimonas sp.]